jgi:cell division protease FtsH
LGAAWYLPEERSITTTEQLLDQMCSALGGRAAEELVFSKISTGALSDLEKITKQAYAMVSIYGLNKRVGNISFYDSQGRDAFTKPYSDETAKIIDEEVSKLVESQYQRALKIITENKDKLELLAEKLLIDEVIFKENLEEIFGKRPWDPAELIEEKETGSKDSASENEQLSSSEVSPSEENQTEDPTDNTTPPKNESETTEE